VLAVALHFSQASGYGRHGLPLSAPMRAVKCYRLIDYDEAKTALARNNKENIKR